MKAGAGPRGNLLCLFARLVVMEFQQVDHGLAQKLVESHLGSVHDDDVQSTALGVSRVEKWQVKRGLLLPHRSDAFFRHRGGKFVFGQLDDGIGVVAAILSLYAEVPSLMHRYLDTRGEKLLALAKQRHSKVLLSLTGR